MTTTGRRIFVDEVDAPAQEPDGAGQAPPKPPPAAASPAQPGGDEGLKDLISIGNLIDKGLDHLRGVARSPAEREGLRYLVDALVRGREPKEPSPAAKQEEQAVEDKTAEATKAESKAMRASIDTSKLMAELEGGIGLLVQIYGNEPISSLPGRLTDNRAAVEKALGDALKKAIVYEAVDGS